MPTRGSSGLQGRQLRDAGDRGHWNRHESGNHRAHLRAVLHHQGSGRGTGLGLATVYGVVKQSNGYIWVDSTPGKGSTFQIYLPKHLDTELVSVAKPKSNPGEAARIRNDSSREDAEPLRKLAQAFLESNGFRVLSAQSGEAALETAARYSGRFDLLLTDVVMPGMNGRVLAEQCRCGSPG